ncbi:hypothetical protein NVIRPANT_00009 [Pantoea sp. Nvir]|nr:hypothetical protein NVIRPANT_00009 [Pantoea sp. Nvir]
MKVRHFLKRVLPEGTLYVVGALFTINKCRSCFLTHLFSASYYSYIKNNILVRYKESFNHPCT